MDKFDREIIELTRSNVHDKMKSKKLMRAFFRGEGHSARLITEGMCEKYPMNKPLKRLDDLITNKFF